MLNSEIFLVVLVVIVVAYAAASVHLLLNETRYVYNPEPGIAITPDMKGFKYEDVMLRSKDGVKLHAWYVPAPPHAGVILFCHGNTGNISHRFETLEMFYRLGFDTFIFDYRGYGLSEGVPSEQGTYLDAQAAWDYLTVERGIAPERIILFGRSLGGAVASWLAVNSHPCALVVESSFTSLPELAQSVYPWLPVRWLAKSRYNTLERIGKVNCPILIIHSRNDELIPFRHGELLYSACSVDNKALLEIRGRHNDGFVMSGEMYLGGVRDFFSRVMLSPNQPEIGG